MTATPIRIAMWSGPRNLSTAMMYSFAARGVSVGKEHPVLCEPVEVGGFVKGAPVTTEIALTEIVHEEFVLIDAAGRLQIPREYLERLDIHERARVLMGEGRVEVRPEANPRGTRRSG